MTPKSSANSPGSAGRPMLQEEWQAIKQEQQKVRAKLDDTKVRLRQLRLSLVTDHALTIIFFGLIINLALFALFDFRFTALSWLGWGILYYIVVDELYLPRLWLKPRGEK